MPPHPRLLVLVLSLAAALAAGCGEKTRRAPEPAPPSATFTGPAFLRGTVSSMAKLRGYQPLLTSGYGLVVDLPGTGSSDVPSYLRQWLINEMRKKGWGSARLGTANRPPARVLASDTSAVVRVDGLIPPGATRGTRFDVLVTALPQTQTTSLQGGRLFTTSLGVEGASETLRFTRPLARAYGPTYVGRTTDPGGDRETFHRQAVILSGGTVTENRALELMLHHPSWQRSRMISDRINERFGLPTDHPQIAVAKTDLRIVLNIPDRYAANPRWLLEQISHLFVQRGPGFEREKARELLEILEQRPDEAGRIASAWTALGKTVLPVLRNAYDHRRLEVRLAALDTGAALQDERAVEPLADLAQLPDPSLRRRAAQLLGRLPESIRGARILHELVDDPARTVRTGAADALAAIADPLLQRVAIRSTERLKLILDLIPSKRPLIYVQQAGTPRMTVFGLETGFNRPLLASVWDNRLMLRADEEPGTPVKVFFQRRGSAEARTYEIAPTIGNLVFLLGHKPTREHPTDGLDLSYGQIVAALHALAEAGAIEADVVAHMSELAERVETAQKANEEDAPRPEIDQPVIEAPQPGGDEQAPERGQ